MEDKSQTSEELLVKMTALLNELARSYDSGGNIPYFIDRAYKLSLEGYSHLNELDRLTSERDEAVTLLRNIIEMDETYLESGKAFDDIKVFLDKTAKQ